MSETSSTNGSAHFGCNSDRQDPLRVAIVGGGLVGSMNACFFARRGFHVDLYEYREDIRSVEEVRGRSINLALSFRGLSALEKIGLKEAIVAHGIPMHARMVHDRDGTRRPVPYGTKEQFIMSVSRRHLNELLLTAAEKNNTYTPHFRHKLVNADLTAGTMTFLKDGSAEISASADLVVGTDGAFSTVRQQMLKLAHFNFSQQYIEHGYKELYMPPNEKGEYQMEKNYLHIWARDSFMLIALPNLGGSYTVTLFMPFSQFREIDTDDALLDFFRSNFPDALELIGESRLLKDYFSVEPSFLITVKCHPYHVSDKTVIMGDAAHAMVPFYGQGMNCGFEDCLIFDELLSTYACQLDKVLPEFSRIRNPDAEAICDLALYNYIEMRHLVNSTSFLLRKKVDALLHYLLPNTWVPMYTQVTFTRTPYRQIVENRAWQDRVIHRAVVAAGIAGVVCSVAASVWCSRNGDLRSTFFRT